MSDSMYDDIENGYEFHVERNVDIESLKGNYIFTVGNVSSGKTCFQNMLISRLWNKKDIEFNFSAKRDSNSHDASLLMWVKSFLNGKLPDRTKAGMLQEFNVSIGQKKRPTLNLNFLEISGEDIIDIMPSVDGHEEAQFNPQLTRYLKNKKINKRFVFVSDCTANKKGSYGLDGVHEDALFHRFISFLRDKEGAGLERINILFVAAKWDEVHRDYENPRDYFNKNFGQTLSALGNKKIDSVYMPFSIGTIEMKSNDDDLGVTEPVITSFEYKYVDYFIQWVYFSYMKKSLKGLPISNKSWLDMIIEFLSVKR